VILEINPHMQDFKWQSFKKVIFTIKGALIKGTGFNAAIIFQNKNQSSHLIS
jgi:hypothetical protein